MPGLRGVGISGGPAPFPHCFEPVQSMRSEKHPEAASWGLGVGDCRLPGLYIHFRPSLATPAFNPAAWRSAAKSPHSALDRSCGSAADWAPLPPTHLAIRPLRAPLRVFIGHQCCRSVHSSPPPNSPSGWRVLGRRCLRVGVGPPRRLAERPLGARALALDTRTASSRQPRQLLHLVR